MKTSFSARAGCLGMSARLECGMGSYDSSPTNEVAANPIRLGAFLQSTGAFGFGSRFSLALAGLLS
jgi:hypothetical protein